MSYHLETLGDERFQQLAQALIVNAFPNAQCLPVGQPDGGRDAFLRSRAEKPKGELIIFQVKYARDPNSRTARDQVSATIKTEAEKVRQLIQRGATSYYLITNVPGTAHLTAGTIDIVDDVLWDLYTSVTYRAAVLECSRRRHLMAQVGSTTRTVTFRRPFTLPSVGRQLPAGTYQVTDTTVSVNPRFGLTQTNTVFHVGGGSAATLMPGELERALNDDQSVL